MGTARDATPQHQTVGDHNRRDPPDDRRGLSDRVVVFGGASVMMKTFKAADGRRIRAKMSADEIRHEIAITITSVLTPAITFVLFVWASGILK